MEVEAGRGAGNAVYLDLVRSSLIVDQRLLVLGVMGSYRHQSNGRPIIVSSYGPCQQPFLQQARMCQRGAASSSTAGSSGSIQATTIVGTIHSR